MTRTNARKIAERLASRRNPGADTPRRSRMSTWILVAWAAVAIVVTSLLLAGQSERSTEAQSATPLTAQLFVDPNSQAATWVKTHEGHPAAASVRNRIANQPTAKWFGAWSGDIKSAVSQYVSLADERGEVPVLVAYNVPGRDCGGYSSGGLTNADQYGAWIDGFAEGLDDRRAIVVLEPDALAQLDSCLGAEQQQQRLSMLARAVNRLQSRNVSVYLDAGHSNWVPADQMAKRLRQAGVEQAHGFALNVSNYQATTDEAQYAAEVNRTLGTAKPFLIDTSRNGNGSQDGEWCNPAGTKLGTAPRMIGSDGMLLWIKAPGESDGTCGTAPSTAAGNFTPELASLLIEGE
jgi:endoglucanase